jgi:hypothetical protein
MEDQYRPKHQSRPRTRRRTHGKASPVVAILVALVLIALVVTAVICMLRKPALPTQGAAKAKPGSVMAVATISCRSLTLS